MNQTDRNPIYVAVSIGVILVIVLLLLAVDENVLQPASLQPDKAVSLLNYCTETDKTYEIYRTWVVQQHQRAFEWHARSSKILFWVSMIVAISGIAFAFWQFIDASDKDTKAMKADELELKTQLGSLAFKSRSIAALVMFMSIAYLLIYVKLVHPVKYVPISPLPSTQATAVESGEQGVAATPTTRRSQVEPSDGALRTSKGKKGER